MSATTEDLPDVAGIAAIREWTDLGALAREVGRPDGSCPFCGAPPFDRATWSGFRVNETTKVWHCFSCKEAGDCFTLLQKTRGVSFADAVRTLAGAR